MARRRWTYLSDIVLHTVLSSATQLMSSVAHGLCSTARTWLTSSESGPPNMMFFMFYFLFIDTFFSNVASNVNIDRHYQDLTQFSLILF